MTLLSNDPDTQLAFSVYENKGVFAVLLGSGLSRSASIPTGWEITLDLIRRIATAQGHKDELDWASILLEDLAVSSQERRSILHSYIEPSEDDRREGHKLPTKAQSNRNLSVLASRKVTERS
jgi:hypothetical protein